jgi:hypothetical protein
MLFDPLNFFQRAHEIKTGDPGFLADLDVPCESMALDAATRGITSNSVIADTIIFDANSEAAILSLLVPRDYDRETDELRFRFRVRHVSGTSISLQPDVASRARADEDLAAITFTPPAAVVVNAAFDIGDIELDLTGLDFRGGDRVFVRLVASARAADGIAHLLGGQVVYRSTLVAYDDADGGQRDIA